jgi:hypothetical protein
MAVRVDITTIDAFFDRIDDAFEFDDPSGIEQAHLRRGEPEP